MSPAVPVIERADEGVDEPIPIFPLAETLKKDDPVDEATLKISLVDPEIPCTLKAIVDDVALIPATVPLSRSVDVPRVVEVSHRVAKPRAPPVRDAERPRDDVATQRVLVPVD